MLYLLLMVGCLQVAEPGERDGRADTGERGYVVSRSMHHVGYGHVAQVYHKATNRCQGHTLRLLLFGFFSMLITTRNTFCILIVGLIAWF